MIHNKTLKVIAITGTIGSGKSTVAKIFGQRGVAIIDADLLAREAVLPGSPALSEIIGEFGTKVLNQDGSLDRKALGELVFSDSKKRLKLEQITHPRIRELFSKKIGDLTRLGTVKIAAYVVPLLFESKNKYPEITKVVVVKASEEECLKRVMQRDSITKEQALKRLKAQLPISEKIRRADFTIDNSADRASLDAQVEQILLNL